MKPRKLFGRPLRELAVTAAPAFVAVVVTFFVVARYVNPAPPKRLIISTGSGEGDYQAFAEQYRDIIKHDGVILETRKSTGARENLERVADPKSDVDVGFAQDGLETKVATDDVVSLGSLYYEPMWVFYRGSRELTRISELRGKKIAVGERGGGAPVLAAKLLEESGLGENDVHKIPGHWEESAQRLLKGEVDAAFFLATPEDALVKRLLAAPGVRLMSFDQAEAISRLLPFLHHLVLPHGAIDVARNLPDKDTHLVATTATLVAKDNLHPALVFLLLKAAQEVHSVPGIFERKGEFPVDKDYHYPIDEDAERYYKTGTPFWQRHLPFWLASLVERFIIVVLPLLAFVVPIVRGIPKFLESRVQARIHKCYGELKFLETQIKREAPAEHTREHLRQLDAIEERVRHMKLPLDFSEHMYVLREHIEFVRARLDRELARAKRAS